MSKNGITSESSRPKALAKAEVQVEELRKQLADVAGEKHSLAEERTRLRSVEGAVLIAFRRASGAEEEDEARKAHRQAKLKADNLSHRIGQLGVKELGLQDSIQRLEKCMETRS